MTTHPASRRATARDVAARAGCSASTVSLVFTGKDTGRVSPRLRSLVFAAAAELGYRVNSTASALARGQLESIGFVAPDPTNPFFSMVLEGLTRHLDGTFSLTVLLPEGGEDYSLATAQRAMAGNLAGLILASPGTEFLESLVPTCPTVVLDAGGAAGELPSVDLDLRGAARELSGHLASALSTVNLFPARLGAEAAALLGRYIRTGSVPASTELLSALVVRESTGPAHPRGPHA